MRDDDDERFVAEPECKAFSGLDRATRWRRAKAGLFPKPVKISARRVAWRLGDLKAWRRDPEHYQAAP